MNAHLAVHQVFRNDGTLHLRAEAHLRLVVQKLVAPQYNGAALDINGRLAVLRYAPPKLNENTDAGTQAATMVEAACAAARWADLRDDVDHNSIGVLAYGPSALVAVAAASEIRIIRRLCLIDLATQLPMATPENGRGASHVAGNGELMVDSLLHQGGPTALTGFDGEVMFLNAAADRVTPLNSTLAYRRALENHQRVAEHVLIARADHGYQDVSLRAVCAEQATRFFLHR